MKKIVVLSIILISLGLVQTNFAQSDLDNLVNRMDDVTVENIVYRTVDDTSFTMDVYYPPDMDMASPLPVVIFVNGFRDGVFDQAFGSSFKDTAFMTPPARLIAASGLIAILYESEQPDDLVGIDATRIGVWGSSSTTPAAISFAMQSDREFIKAAAFFYGDMITPDEQHNTTHDEFCMNFPPPDGGLCYLTSELEPIENIRRDLPMFIVRTGGDNGENPSIDHFVAVALENNARITLVNYSFGQHGFDLLSNDAARQITEHMLLFFKANLVDD